MMTSKSLATNHRMRHQSLNLNKGALKSMGGQETAAQSGSLVVTGPEFN